MKTCLKCSAIVPDDSVRCTNCGADCTEAPVYEAPVEAPVEQAAPVVEVPVSGKLCPKCGAPTPEDSRFCPRCGADGMEDVPMAAGCAAEAGADGMEDVPMPAECAAEAGEEAPAAAPPPAAAPKKKGKGKYIGIAAAMLAVIAVLAFVMGGGNSFKKVYDYVDEQGGTIMEYQGITSVVGVSTFEMDGVKGLMMACGGAEEAGDYYIIIAANITLAEPDEGLFLLSLFITAMDENGEEVASIEMRDTDVLECRDLDSGTRIYGTITRDDPYGILSGYTDDDIYKMGGQYGVYTLEAMDEFFADHDLNVTMEDFGFRSYK